MQQRYGWAPRIALSDGLRETVAYFRSWMELRETAAA
jgi:CRISPR/Cas system CMR-associated protein Cmr5 small subunit